MLRRAIEVPVLPIVQVLRKTPDCDGRRKINRQIAEDMQVEKRQPQACKKRRTKPIGFLLLRFLQQ